MTLLVNLPGGLLLKETSIHGFGPAYTVNTAGTLFATKPYKAYAACNVYFSGSASGVSIKLTDPEEFDDPNDITDAVLQSHLNDGVKKRDKIIKGIWP